MAAEAAFSYSITDSRMLAQRAAVSTVQFVTFTCLILSRVFQVQPDRVQLSHQPRTPATDNRRVRWKLLSNKNGTDLVNLQRN